MPFTFSHPAIVLPLAKLPVKWRSVTGLVVGSITPDFEKFFRMDAHDFFSHTWKSIFYFNLPVALLLAFLFHLVVRDQLIAHLPAFLKKRLIVFHGFNWIKYFKQHYAIVLVSILLGVCSHLFWDGFTHSDGRFLRWWPILGSEIHINEKEFSIFNVLQATSTLIGGFIVFIAIILLPPNKIPASGPPKPYRYWLLTVLLTANITAIKLNLGLDYGYLANLVVTIISGLLWSLLIISWLKQRKYIS